MDRGVQRRLLVMTFNRVIPKEECIEGIGKLIAEKEANLLLAWAVEGAMRLIQNRNFTIPQSSQEALEDWLITADPVQAWINDRVEVNPIYTVTTREAYNHFKFHAEAEGFKPALLPSINAFVARVKANAPRGIEYKRTQYDRCFYGMRLLADGERRQDSFVSGSGENTSNVVQLHASSGKVTLSDGRVGEIL